MSDRMAAEIEIGGLVHRQIVPRLIEMIKLEGVFVGWGEERFEATNAEELVNLATRTSEKGILLLANYEASGGQFEKLEAFFVEHRIAFDRRSQAKFDYDAELYQFRPSMEKPILWLADQIGRAAILVSALEPVQIALDRGQDQEAGRLLREVMGPEIPALEPLRISQ